MSNIKSIVFPINVQNTVQQGGRLHLHLHLHAYPAAGPAARPGLHCPLTQDSLPGLCSQ